MRDNEIREELHEIKRLIMALADTLATLAADDTELAADFTALQGFVATLQNNVAALTAEVAQLEAGSPITADQVAALETLSADLGTLHTNLSGLVPAVSPPSTPPA
jgi:uncharacterized phage infection (PIP) family protein YhgE